MGKNELHSACELSVKLTKRHLFELRMNFYTTEDGIVDVIEGRLWRVVYNLATRIFVAGVIQQFVYQMMCSNTSQI